jgi:hypothetical protein
MHVTKINQMKKVFFVCMMVGLLATSCDWFKSKPDEPEIVDVTDVTTDSTLTTTDDSTAQTKDSAVAVVEKITETKKEVKK